MDWTLPDELHAAPRDDRIRWHRERVAVHLPVFDFLDEIDSGEDVLGVRRQLNDLRDEIAELELELELREDPTFVQLEHALCRQVNRLGILKDLVFGTHDPERRRLRAQVRAVERQIKDTEEDICKVCRSVWGTCPFGKECIRLHTRSKE